MSDKLLIGVGGNGQSRRKRSIKTSFDYWMASTMSRWQGEEEERGRFVRNGQNETWKTQDSLKILEMKKGRKATKPTMGVCHDKSMSKSINKPILTRKKNHSKIN